MSEYTDRQLQIIDAAIELISKGGIQELTMKNLSKRIGISEPAIYRHFENKAAILESIPNNFLIAKQTLMTEILDTQLFSIDKITKFIEMHFTGFSQKPALASVIFSEEIFQNDQHIAGIISKIMKKFHLTLTKIVSDGQKNKEIRQDVPPEHFVTIIMGSLRLIIKKWHFSKHSFDLQEQGRSFCESLRKILEPAKNIDF